MQTQHMVKLKNTDFYRMTGPHSINPPRMRMSYRTDMSVPRTSKGSLSNLTCQSILPCTAPRTWSQAVTGKGPASCVPGCLLS